MEDSPGEPKYDVFGAPIPDDQTVNGKLPTEIRLFTIELSNTRDTTAKNAFKLFAKMDNLNGTILDYDGSIGTTASQLQQFAQGVNIYSNKYTLQ